MVIIKKITEIPAKFQLRRQLFSSTQLWIVQHKVLLLEFKETLLIMKDQPCLNSNITTVLLCSFYWPVQDHS